MTLRSIRSIANRVSNWAPVKWSARHPYRANVILTVLYRLCLDLVYRFAVSPLYGYSGLTVSWNPAAWFSSLLAVIVFAPVVVKTNRPASSSSILITLLNHLYFIPLTSYYGCKGTCDVKFFIIALVFWALLLFWQKVLPVIQLRPIPARYTHISMCVLTALSCVFVLYMSGRYTHFRFTLDIIDVYGIRSEAATYQIPVVFRYLISMMPVMLSVELLYWLRKKKYILVAVLIVIYFFLFSFSALKGVFFFLAITVACYYFYRKWMMKWFPGNMAAGSLFVLAVSQIKKLRVILHLTFVRSVYTPINISSQFMGFFHDNPLNLSRDGIMGKLSFQPVYPVDLPSVIGEYRGHFGEHSNNGMLGPLFSDFPLPLGLLLLPLILVICFRLLDMVSAGHKEKILMPFCIYFAVAYMNGTWSGILLSTGLLVAALLVYLFPREEEVSV